MAITSPGHLTDERLTPAIQRSEIPDAHLLFNSLYPCSQGKAMVGATLPRAGKPLLPSQDSVGKDFAATYTEARITALVDALVCIAADDAGPGDFLTRPTMTQGEVRSKRLPRTVGDPSRVSQEGKLELTDAPRSVETVAERIPEGFRMADSERVTVKAWSNCHGFTPYLPFSTAASSAIPTSRQI
jgi:hypothetical protein